MGGADWETRAKARAIRSECLKTTHAAQLGHLGADFSALETLIVLYDRVLRFPNGDLSHPDRDRFVLSKGHAALAYYAVLSRLRERPVANISEFAKFGSALSGHPSNTKVKGIETSTGPLGHGLPFGVGAALAAKLEGSSRRIFVLVGDGELQEGSNWEAAMLAGSRQLDNLLTIVDRNRLQQGRGTELVNRLEPLTEKWRAFGWSVREVDGHDPEQLFDVLTSIPFKSGMPSCVVAHTTKGRGVSFMEGKAAWHHKVPSLGELDLALAELAEG